MPGDFDFDVADGRGFEVVPSEGRPIEVFPLPGRAPPFSLEPDSCSRGSYKTEVERLQSAPSLRMIADPKRSRRRARWLNPIPFKMPATIEKNIQLPIMKFHRISSGSTRADNRSTTVP